jgi:hydrogenase maturation protease
MTRQDAGRVVVLGVGNLLLGDEGVGVHVAGELMTIDLPPHVEVVEAGTMPVEGLGAVDDVAKVVIVDAVRAHGPAGAVYRLPASTMTGVTGAMSLHEMTLADALAYWTVAGLDAERIVIIGVQPHSVQWGTELSEAVRDALPTIINAVVAEVTCERTEGDDSHQAEAD